MREMQTTVTDVHSVCLSCSSSRLRCAKTAERIKMLFGVNTPGGPWNIVSDGGADPSTFDICQREEGDIIFEFSSRLCLGNN